LPTPEAAIDRVLALEPRNAEALYYKGRMYGGSVLAGIRATKRFDLERAVSFLRQAVEIAPNNLKYRKILALFLADQGRPGEAKALMRAAQKDDLMVKLLGDLESLPVPEGAELFLSHPYSDAAWALTLLESGFGDHLRVRLHTYRIAKSPAEIDAFYASRLPGFRFIPDDENPSESEFGHVYNQFLRVKSGIMRASRDRLEIPKQLEPGIWMQLVEMQNDPELQRKLGPGEHNCYLILVNLRK
jgi:tetratricopeptide (TPR) repeat protein